MVSAAVQWAERIMRKVDAQCGPLRTVNSLSSTSDAPCRSSVRLRRFLHAQRSERLFIIFLTLVAHLFTVAGALQVATARVWLAAIGTVHRGSTTDASVIRRQPERLFNLAAVFQGRHSSSLAQAAGILAQIAG